MVDFKQLKSVIRLMVDYQLEAIKFSPTGQILEVTKKVHNTQAKLTNPFKVSIGSEEKQDLPVNWTDEDLLFYSSGSPPPGKRPLHEIDRFAANPPQEEFPKKDN